MNSARSNKQIVQTIGMQDKMKKALLGKVKPNKPTNSGNIITQNKKAIN